MTKPVIICEIYGGVLTDTHTSVEADGYVLDHDNIEGGDKHEIPDDAFRAVGLDPDDYRQPEPHDAHCTCNDCMTHFIQRQAQASETEEMPF